MLYLLYGYSQLLCVKIKRAAVQKHIHRCVCVLFQTSIYDKSKAIDCWIQNGGLPLEWFWEILAIKFDSIWFD